MKRDPVLLRRTFDLNKPDDARDYLTTLEAEGKLSFDDMTISQDLNDPSACEVAKLVFNKLNPNKKGAVAQ